MKSLSKEKISVPFLSFEKTNQMIKAEIMSRFEDFFDSKWYILGESVKIFEAEYADFNQVKYCLGVSNGLDALHLALLAFDIGKGDEVIVPSNTFIATVLAISYCGATPIFVEPDIKTYNIDSTKIENAITNKTKAIMPVHLYGQACNMTAIMTIAKNYNLYVIEDNAQSQGATWNGQITGSFGDLNGVSFYPGKNLGALGDAGALTTNNESLANKIKSLRNYGSIKKYHNEVVGYNHRLDECQAGFLSVKLQYLNKWNKERQQIANWYCKYLSELDDIILPTIDERATSVFHLFVIRCKQRDRLQKFLKENGVGTLIHYPIPPHLQEAYQSLRYSKGDFPIAEEIATTCLSLPIFIGLEEEIVQQICTLIKSFFNKEN